jgi:FkbM family methyltransferase
MLFSTLVGPTGKVISFEPIPYIFDKLTKSRAENNFESICELHNCALSDIPGVVKMIYAPVTTNFGGSYITQEKTAPAEHAIINVPARKLDEFISDKRVDFIKIDVEGAEPKIFAGGRDLITRDMPTILCEVSNAGLKRVSSSNGTELISSLITLGYQCNVLLPDGNLGDSITGYEGDGYINVVFSKGRF